MQTLENRAESLLDEFKWFWSACTHTNNIILPKGFAYDSHCTLWNNPRSSLEALGIDRLQWCSTRSHADGLCGVCEAPASTWQRVSDRLYRLVKIPSTVYDAGARLTACAVYSNQLAFQCECVCVCVCDIRTPCALLITGPNDQISSLWCIGFICCAPLFFWMSANGAKRERLGASIPLDELRRSSLGE